MFSRDRQNVECSEVSGLAPGFHIELGADTTDEFRNATLCRKHPG